MRRRAGRTVVYLLIAGAAFISIWPISLLPWETVLAIAKMTESLPLRHLLASINSTVASSAIYLIACGSLYSIARRKHSWLRFVVLGLGVARAVLMPMLNLLSAFGSTPVSRAGLTATYWLVPHMALALLFLTALVAAEPWSTMPLPRAVRRGVFAFALGMMALTLIIRPPLPPYSDPLAVVTHAPTVLALIGVGMAWGIDGFETLALAALEWLIIGTVFWYGVGRTSAAWHLGRRAPEHDRVPLMEEAGTDTPVT